MQRDLFDGKEDDDKPRTIEERFQAFHLAHPDVYQLFKDYAFCLLRIGRQRYSADAILHRVRWHYATSGPDDSGFKINDHFSSRYARLLIAEHPEFEGFFELRVIRSE